MVLHSIWPALICILGSCILMAIKTAVNRLKTSNLDSLVESWPKELLFFRLVQRLFRKKHIFPITDFLSLTGIITLVGYAIAGSSYLLMKSFLSFGVTTYSGQISIALYWFLIATLWLAAIAVLLYAAFHLLATKFPLAVLRIFSYFSMPYLFLLFPLTYLIIWLEKTLIPLPDKAEPQRSADKLKIRLMEILEDEEFVKRIDSKDKRLLNSVAHFGDLSAREVMVPRIDIETLENTATIQDALEVFVREGYSRLPIYKENVDYMVGMLLFKDLITHCYRTLNFDQEKMLEEPISKLINPILYAPENKRIRDLFQEMRQNKIHLAIVVNEYGVTEGLVTIEDILEELVGSEILDEHDNEEEDLLFKRSSEMEWFVDAKMSILDAEKEFGITLPHHAEYETIGGFVSSVFGSIPPSGTIVHHEKCILQVLESNKRQIHKVKITKQIDS